MAEEIKKAKAPKAAKEAAPKAEKEVEAKVVAEKPVKAKAEKPVEAKVVAEKPVKAKAEKPVEAKVAAEKPVKAKAEKPVEAKVAAEKPAKAKAEKPAKAVEAKVVAEKPVHVHAEKPAEAPKAEPAVEVKAKVEIAAAPKAQAPKDAKGKVEAKAKAPFKPEPKQPNRLKVRFNKEIVPSLMAKYKYGSVMEVPSVEKIVINIGVGDATTNSKLLDDSVRELGEITGQKPIITKAKKSVASFKLREGQAIGCKVTLRGIRMYEFLDKLVSVALPRVRDFRGISKNSFDGHGNYTLGIKEQLIFPEINYDKVGKIRGMDIVLVTSAKNDEEAFTLLSELGLPFHK